MTSPSPQPRPPRAGNRVARRRVPRFAGASLALHGIVAAAALAALHAEPAEPPPRMAATVAVTPTLEDADPVEVETSVDVARPETGVEPAAEPVPEFDLEAALARPEPGPAANAAVPDLRTARVRVGTPRRRDAGGPVQGAFDGDEEPAPSAAVASDTPRPRTPGKLSPPVPDEDNERPVYPRIARRRGIGGVVVLSVHVDPTGAVTSVEVHHGSGNALLDDAARDAALEWRFLPARRDGEPCAAVVRQAVRFVP